jgi:hypothetical protein
MVQALALVDRLDALGIDLQGRRLTEQSHVEHQTLSTMFEVSASNDPLHSSQWASRNPHMDAGGQCGAWHDSLPYLEGGVDLAELA